MIYTLNAFAIPRSVNADVTIGRVRPVGTGPALSTDMRAGLTANIAVDTTCTTDAQATADANTTAKAAATAATPAGRQGRNTERQRQQGTYSNCLFSHRFAPLSVCQ
jgi:hypothetical protein